MPNDCISPGWQDISHISMRRVEGCYIGVTSPVSKLQTDSIEVFLSDSSGVTDGQW